MRLGNKIDKGDHCLNCDQELHGENYCPNCGQLNDISKPTLKEVMGDALNNIFNLDARFYRSVVTLLFKPGKLSLEYFDGRRTMFTSPVRLLIISTFIFLIVQSFNTGSRTNTFQNDKVILNADTLGVNITSTDTVIAEGLLNFIGSSVSLDSALYAVASIEK